MAITIGVSLADGAACYSRTALMYTDGSLSAPGGKRRINTWISFFPSFLWPHIYIVLYTYMYCRIMTKGGWAEVVADPAPPLYVARQHR